MDEKKQLEQFVQILLQPENFKQIFLTKEWISGIPSNAGVYVLKDDDEIVYVGETGNLRGRMKDLLDTRNHSLRRRIGEKFYSDIDGFKRATARIKFPEHIEFLVNEHICKRLVLGYIEVSFGRKELEETIQAGINKSFGLNVRGKRKSS